MIQAYAGEFTCSPIPLEMSMNYCSHKCAYCFANLNTPGRELNVTKVINQIRNCNKGSGLTSYLLANQYPVLLSNRVDPFAKTNWRQSLSFIELFNKNGNKIAFQTKGGEGIDEALALIDYPASWYISISFINDRLRKLIEPGAPSVADRFKLIEKLIAKGHHVSVGINPLVEEWLPFADFEALVNRLVEIGVRNFWVEILHLNSKQIANMSQKEVDNIGGAILSESSKRSRNISYFKMCVNYIMERGLNVFSINQPFKTNYFESYHKLYEGKTLKTHQDFINYCFEKYPNGGLVKWQEYYDFMSQPFYEHSFSEADGYAYRIARNVYRNYVDKPLRQLKEVLEFYYLNEDVSKSIFNNSLFDILTYTEGKKVMRYVDKEHNMWIAYFNAGKLSPSRSKTVELDEIEHFLLTLKS